MPRKLVHTGFWLTVMAISVTSGCVPFGYHDKPKLKVESQKLAKFPVIVTSKSWDGIEDLSRFFEVQGTHPPGTIEAKIAKQELYSSTTFYSKKGQSYICAIRLTIQDWQNNEMVVFQCVGNGEGSTYSAVAGLSTGADSAGGDEKQHADALRASYQRAMVDLLKKLDARRSELEGIRSRYAEWRQKWQ